MTHLTGKVYPKMIIIIIGHYLAILMSMEDQMMCFR